jgi:hypothetical protein
MRVVNHILECLRNSLTDEDVSRREKRQYVFGELVSLEDPLLRDL